MDAESLSDSLVDSVLDLGSRVPGSIPSAGKIEFNKGEAWSNPQTWNRTWDTCSKSKPATHYHRYSVFDFEFKANRRFLSLNVPIDSMESIVLWDWTGSRVNLSGNQT